MRFIILSLLLLFMTQSAHAEYDGIFRILDERYVENVADLPPSNPAPDKTLNPSLEWLDEYCNDDETSRNCPFGWLDIVGFTNMVRIGDAYYIQGDPADAAIIQYETHVLINGRYYLKGWEYDLQKEVSDGMLIARLRAKAILCQRSWDGYESCANETFELSDSEPAPRTYPSLSEPQVIVTQYNNSLYENIGIKILGGNYTKITFGYQDKQAVRTTETLHVENTSKGIVYGNMTMLDQWKIEGTGISRFYNEILMDGNLSKMDINEFDIRVYNPYTSRKADPENFTIQREEFAPHKIMSGLLIAVVGMVSTLTIGSLYLVNKMRSKWRINLF